MAHIVWIVEGWAVLEGKVVRPGTHDGDAYILLADGRTVVRSARLGVFATADEAAGCL